MATVYICIRVGLHPQRYAHQRLKHHEIHLCHRSFSIVFVINGNFIVSTHLQAASVVRHLKGIVGVKRIRIERFLEVVNGISFCKALAEIALKEFPAFRPVSLTMPDRIGETMVLMGHVVKRDVDGLPIGNADDGQVAPSIAGYDLK